MNPIRLISSCMLAALLGYSISGHAEDIDIYSGSTANGTPNLMFVVDNPASQNSNVGACTYWDGTASSESPNALGNDQCALANIVHGLPTTTSGAAVIKLGITTMCGIHMPLTPIDDNLYPGTPITRTFNTGPCSPASDQVTYTIPAGSTNRQAFIIAVKALKPNTGKSGQGSELQETWAYYTGGNGGTTGTGILTGTTYAGTNATTGCQKNYIIYLSNVKAGASHAQQYDATEQSKLTAAIDNEIAKRTVAHPDWGISAAQGDLLKAAITPSLEAGQGREWARFMKTVDLNTTAAGTGTQSIITYSVATGDTAVPPAAITNSMEQYIKAVSTYGGGKYYPAGNDSTVLTNSILKILNEVQAVNSVFSSSSLPVSVNAQGTYLNQIYMGMFRPDPEGNPRWVGNLKQYHFVATRDPVTHLVSLSLGDSLDAEALNPTTGFISPNAVSFWTCTRTDNPYYTGTLTAAQRALLTANGQTCATDPANGFWVNDALKADSVGAAYDLSDGEWVDKGGAAQIVRLANLTNDYSTDAGTGTNLRKLYTCTGTCSGSSPNNLLSSYPFDNSNTNLTPAVFGIITPKTISSLTRSGSTATVTTAVAHGVTDGQVVQVSGVDQSEYNGSFVMTVTSPTTVTYTPNILPVTPATGTISASLPPPGVAITSLTRTGSTVTVSANGNGLSSGDSVIISGVTPADYNGTWVINCGVVGTSCNAIPFTFTGPAEGPATPAGGGKAAVSGYSSATIADVSANPAPGLVRAGTLVTVKTTANHGFPASGTVTISDAPVGYNGTFSFTWTGNKAFTYTLDCLTPCPATTLGTASPTSGTSISIDTLTRTLGAGTAATATATTTGATALTDLGLVIGNTYSINISGANQVRYNGTFSGTVTAANTFTYPINTDPATPATGTMILGSSLAAPDLIKWVRGYDNFGDEFGPGGSVTIRPSLHGDVLHSRPVTVNYGLSPITITGTSDSGSIRTATASAAHVTILASSAAPGVKFANGESCNVTVASSTTFTYSTTNCGAAGAQAGSITSNSNVVVFYGGNDGVFRAVNGNQNTAMSTTGGSVAPGAELWGFIPSEFFSGLKRLHDNSPILDLPSTIPGISPTPQKKTYFADGSTGVYQLLNSDGSTSKAYLYISMRRGGKFIYALDVTDPAVPKYLWKITNTGDFSEMGQTWSAPKVAKIKGYNDGYGNAKPVVIFGAGYSTTQDSEPAGADTMGRGVYIIDAETGALVWKVTKGASSNCATVGVSVSPTTCTVSDMNYSIPSDVTLMDRDNDGYVDRLYAVDVGGNVWRIDLQPEGSALNITPDYWRIRKMASLGGSCCPLRKFFYPADVVPTNSYDAVIVGSGDREHPLYTNDAADKQNRIFMLKDVTGNDGSSLGTLTKSSLFDATSATYSAAAASHNGSVVPNKGYFIDLLDGEKAINAPSTVAGYTYLGTHQPTDATTCSANLGIARGYKLNPLSGAYTVTEFTGGGLPPSPVSGVVSVKVAGESEYSLVPFVIGGSGDDGALAGAVPCTSALCGAKPTISVPTSRIRTYWYKKGK